MIKISSVVFVIFLRIEQEYNYVGYTVIMTSV